MAVKLAGEKMSISKQQREKNLIALKNSIDLGTIDDIIKPTKEWGGAYVIITSSEERVFDPENDKDDFYGHRSQDLFVLTKHSEILSGLFYYVKENILGKRDNYLYGFMALLANEYLRTSGEDDYIQLLKYVIDNIYGYFLYFDWEVGMDDSKEAFDVMRNYLSDEISDDEIRKLL